MIGDAHRVPVESLDRAGVENPQSGLVSSISCTPRRRTRAYEERCETSFGDYTLSVRVEQALVPDVTLSVPSLPHRKIPGSAQPRQGRAGGERSERTFHAFKRSHTIEVGATNSLLPFSFR
jgi:hypothetical protein